jgi:hypothetical protein
MPIEIRELHIRVAVSAPAGSAAAPGQPAPGAAAGGEPERQALVADCVEQVLRIIQNKMER